MISFFICMETSYSFRFQGTTQPAITWSKLTTETFLKFRFILKCIIFSCELTVDIAFNVNNHGKKIIFSSFYEITF